MSFYSVSFIAFISIVCDFHFFLHLLAPFKLGGHPVQRLVDVRKKGVGQQYLVLWGDGTKSWAPARDIEKEPELLRAFEDGL